MLSLIHILTSSKLFNIATFILKKQFTFKYFVCLLYTSTVTVKILLQMYILIFILILYQCTVTVKILLYMYMLIVILILYQCTVTVKILLFMYILIILIERNNVGSVSVSYTHLDVYKRQITYNCHNAEFLKRTITEMLRVNPCWKLEQ